MFCIHLDPIEECHYEQFEKDEFQQNQILKHQGNQLNVISISKPTYDQCKEFCDDNVTCTYFEYCKHPHTMCRLFDKKVNYSRATVLTTYYDCEGNYRVCNNESTSQLNSTNKGSLYTSN